jgi:alkylhydroperoxidase family enzyme
MHLSEVENSFPPGPAGEALRKAREAGAPIPEILHLFAYKPEATRHLSSYTGAVMRAPGPLTAGQRETIAALTSRANSCLF